MTSKARRLAAMLSNNAVLSDGTIDSDKLTGLPTFPTGTVVGVTDAQTLTNKIIESGIFTNGYTEEVYSVTGTVIDPMNGTIQVKQISGDTTFTVNISSGQSLVLTLTNVSTYAITFPTLTWVSPSGNIPPASIADVSVFTFWNIGGTLYAMYVGSGA